VRGRRSLWSDEKVREWAARFVPCTDEVFYLHNRKGAECDFFRGFCEEGHYGGRNKPTNTRQGIYCVAPGGAFLASVNTTDPRRMERMLREAWKAWEALPAERRYMPEAPDPSRARSAPYPAEGLALRSYVRDLPRADEPRGWKRHAWNTDTVWFKAAEARALLPEKLAVGEVREASADRFARFALVDSVRGQTLPYRPGEVKEAVLKSKVISVDGARVRVELTGRSHTDAGGRGVRVEFAGHAVWEGKRFVEFELVAWGERWGATRYNARGGDEGPSPIGFVFTKAADDDRVAPAFWWAYRR